MKLRNIIFFIIISILTLILIPFFIDWIIIGSSLPSNIDDSDWVGFLGGYIGSIIGATVSLIGIVITIRYTNEQNKKDRELQIRPYCSIRYVKDTKIRGTNKILGDFMLGCEPQSNSGSPSISMIYIKNIGLGPAIEFSFEVDEIDDGRKHYPILRQTTSQVLNDSVNLLRPGEEAALGIQIFFNFDPINSDDMEDLEGWGRVVKSSVLGKYKNFKIGITVKYRDMYQNEFNQKITLKSSMGAKYNKDSDHAEHTCELHVDEITNPTRVASKKGNGKK